MLISIDSIKPLSLVKTLSGHRATSRRSGDSSIGTDHLPAEQRPAERCVAGAAVEEVGAALHGQPVQHAEQGVQAGTGCQGINILLCISTMS